MTSPAQLAPVRAGIKLHRQRGWKALVAGQATLTYRMRGFIGKVALQVSAGLVDMFKETACAKSLEATAAAKIGYGFRKRPSPSCRKASTNSGNTAAPRCLGPPRPACHHRPRLSSKRQLHQERDSRGGGVLRRAMVNQQMKRECGKLAKKEISGTTFPGSNHGLPTSNLGGKHEVAGHEAAIPGCSWWPPTLCAGADVTWKVSENRRRESRLPGAVRMAGHIDEGWHLNRCIRPLPPH